MREKREGERERDRETERERERGVSGYNEVYGGGWVMRGGGGECQSPR